MSNEHLWLALQAYARLSPSKIRKVVKACSGDIEGLFYSPTAHLSKILDEQSAEMVQKASEHRDEALYEWEEMMDKGIRLFTFIDTSYPERLLSVRNFPPMLYVWGRVELFNTIGIGICGSRHASEDGLRHSRRFGFLTAKLCLTLISGYDSGTETE